MKYFSLIFFLGLAACAPQTALNEGSASNPQDLWLNQIYKGQLTPGGVNHYKFKIPRDGDYVITLSDLKSNLMVQLWENSNYTSMLNTSDDSDGDHEIVLFNDLSAKNCYLRVYDKSGKPNDFSVKIAKK